MRKILLILALILISVGSSFAADTKVSALTELAVAPAESDEVYINDGGTSKKITVINLLKALEAALTSFGIHADNLPDLSATYEPVDATILRSANIGTSGGPQLYDDDLDAASSATGAGNSKYFGTSGAGVVGYHDLPAADLGFTVDAPGASGGVLQSNGTKWERVASFGSVEIGGMTASMAVHSTPSGILASHSTVSSTELGYLDGLTEALSTSLSNKASTAGVVSNTEYEYLNGVTSAIQAQIDTKAPKLITSYNRDTLSDTSSPHGVVAAEVSGTIISNYSSSAAASEYDLPAAAAGYNFILILGLAQNVTIDPNGTEVIYLNGTALGAGEAVVNATAPAIGESITCFTFQTGASSYAWACKSSDAHFVEETP